ncbi:hypothetical protein [Methylophaga lonarensis]|uniref:hypothetical protein n=1 Tax=Methylophaga lonarensis TaxID=999151 RepID=UPI003D28C109
MSDMRPSIKFNPVELDALKGLPLAARVLYMEGIRPFMDFVTGLVGAPDSRAKRISLQSLAEVLFVEPAPNRCQSGTPSSGHVRQCIRQLVAAGLVESHSTNGTGNNHLILKCVLADLHHSVQKKYDTVTTQEYDTVTTQPKPRHSNGLDQNQQGYYNRPDQAEYNTPQDPGIKHTQYRARARGLRPIPDDFHIDSIVSARLITGGVPMAVAEFFIDEFKAANESSGFLSASWPAELVKFCKRERWRYDKQQSFETSQQSGQGRSPGKAARVHDWLKSEYEKAVAEEQGYPPVQPDAGAVRPQVVKFDGNRRAKTPGNS